MSDNEDQEQTQSIQKIDAYISSIEEQVLKRTSIYGYDDLTVKKLNHKLCQLLNQQAVVNLSKQAIEKGLEWLRKAETLSQYYPEWKVQTYNNLACYYRKLGKPRTALNYLQMALNIELQQPTQSSLPDTYLNMCAVLSQLDRHEDALQHIYLSIIMLQHELLLMTMPQSEFNKLDTTFKQLNSELASRQNSFVHECSTKSDISERIGGKKKQEKYSVLIVAYHNLGVEMEHLKRNLEAVKIFESAMQLAENVLPSNHQMLITLQRIILKNNQKQPQTSQLDQQNIRPQLPKVNQKHHDLKKIYTTFSPNQSEINGFKKKENISFPINCRSSRSQSKTEKLAQRAKLQSLHNTEQLYNDKTQETRFYQKIKQSHFE